MKRKHSILGERHLVPSLITAVTAGLAFSAGSASAQGHTDSRSDTQGAPHTYHQQHGAQATGARSQTGNEEYSLVVWDPATGAWTYVSQETLRDGDRQTAGMRDRDRDEYTFADRDEEDRQTRAQATRDRSVADTRAGATAGRARDREQTLRTQAQRERERAQQTGWRDSRERDMQQRQQARRDSDSPRGQGSASLEGTVEQFREVNLRRGPDAPEEHSWVRVRLESGFHTVVDLGPEKELSDLDLQRGDRISVRGKHATIGGLNVMMADRIRVGNETVNIDRKKSKREISGTIRDYSEVNLDDSEREDHLVVRFEMDDGQRVIADLGSDTSLDDLDIEREADITLTGERRQIGGQQVLVAQRIKVEGDKTKLREKDRDRGEN